MSTPLKTGTLFGSLLYPKVTEWAFGKYQGLDNSTQPVGFSAAVISYCARLASRQKQHQCSEVALSPGHAAGRSPARRPRVGPHRGKVTLSPGIRPGGAAVSNSRTESSNVPPPGGPRDNHRPLCRGPNGHWPRGGWSSVNKPDRPALHPACFSANPSPSLVCRAEN